MIVKCNAGNIYCTKETTFHFSFRDAIVATLISKMNEKFIVQRSVATET